MNHPQDSTVTTSNPTQPGLYLSVGFLPEPPAPPDPKGILLFARDTDGRTWDAPWEDYTPEAETAMAAIVAAYIAKYPDLVEAGVCMGGFWCSVTPQMLDAAPALVQCASRAGWMPGDDEAVQG